MPYYNLFNCIQLYYKLIIKMTSTGQCEKRFKCDVVSCEGNFKTKYSLKRHMKIHKINKEWVCNKCGKQFAL